MIILPDRKARGIRVVLARLALLGGGAKQFLSTGMTIVVVVLGITSTGYAQTNVTGSLAGDAAVGSTITATKLDTGYTRSVKVSPAGSFVMNALPPGRYSVTATGEEDAVIVDVTLATTSSVFFDTNDLVRLDTVQVSGASFNPIDFGRTESVTVFNNVQLAKLPIARHTTAIALMAPGTVKGDAGFADGNLASFGGASVAENAYFVDGFNLSDFRTGIKQIDIPYEAYDQFEIKTGGYSAEFGRSLGGVVNGTTKSGTNTYKAGANVYYTFDSFYEDRPSSYYTDQNGTPNAVWIYNGDDERDVMEANVWASGPIIKDKLFFYGLYNINDIQKQDVVSSGTRIRRQKRDDPFYLGKLTANPFEGQSLEFTYISAERVTVKKETDYDQATKSDLGTSPSTTDETLGGDIKIARYIGSITDDLTLSAMWGESKNTLSTLSDVDAQPLVFDARSGSAQRLSGSTSIVQTGLDSREAIRFDVTYNFSLFGEHQLRAGFDRENNTSMDDSYYSGGVYHRYVPVTPGASLSGGTVPPGVTEVVRDRVYQVVGSFEVKSDAFYIEDNWSVMDDRLRLRIGLRNESFTNLNKAGETFIEIKDQLAPRLGASFDLFDDKKTKLYVNYGRYHMPVASNTNVRLSGGELFTQEYFVLNGVNADGSPIKGVPIGDKAFFSDGSIPDKDTIVDRGIEPMYQDEFIAGIDHALNSDYRVGARGTYRELKSTMDDMIIDHALTDYARNKLGLTTADFSGYNHVVLGNPGKGMQTAWDFEDGNGIVPVTLTAEQLGFEKGVRKYAAVELFFEKIWDGRWAFQASYTWSQSYGNTEGWVLSDNDQDAAGLTLQFDTPDIQRNSYGYLANDRRHAFKFFGSYAITDELLVGVNGRLTSGRGINRIGWYNDSVTGTDYEDSYYLVPRGIAGRMDWVFDGDISFRYTPKWARQRLSFQIDIFNVLNRRTVIEVVETAEIDLSGTPDATYMLPTAWQTPRRVQLSASYGF